MVRDMAKDGDRKASAPKGTVGQADPPLLLACSFAAPSLSTFNLPNGRTPDPDTDSCIPLKRRSGASRRQSSYVHYRWLAGTT